MTISKNISVEQTLRQRYLSAGAVAVLMALTWLIFLPWLGQQPAVRRHVDSLHAADINASAMFYSELDCKYLLQRRR